VSGGFTDSTADFRGLGALLLGSWEKDRYHYAGRVGTGFSDRSSRELRARRDRLLVPKSPFAALPTRDQLTQDAASKDRYVASRANLLLGQLDRGGKLPATYPYPVQVWKLGTGPEVVLLGGEVVVDYALRLKKELPPGSAWIAAYSNDVMAYVPSLRVLKEGGYEGGGAMVYYGLPSPWSPEVEERIAGEVHRLKVR
jgi:hypothetical protein